MTRMSARFLTVVLAVVALLGVLAVSDGTVGIAGWDEGNGISLLLRHRSGYQTMYNHLSKLAAGIRPGGRVVQRQVIDYVGLTGLATGPHLDYRVNKNDVWVNSLSERFIPGESIATSERAEFQADTRALLTRLEREAAFWGYERLLPLP